MAPTSTPAHIPGRPVSAVARASPADLQQVTEHELFMNKKRNEATYRDASCQAICHIKKLLRQPGAQADGRPPIPVEWDKRFKPQLGSFMKFVLGRPDQFRIIDGARPGYYTLDNVAANRTVVAPAPKGKGKGKPTNGGGGKGKGKTGSKGKGKGQLPAKAHAALTKEELTTEGDEPLPLVRTEDNRILPHAARVLAQVAKVQLEEREKGADDEEGEPQDEDADAEGLGWEEAAEGEDDEGMQSAVVEEEAPKRGALISSLLSGGGDKKRSRR
eukprot:TRINITY_DN82272_c0_g1_i1.p1 TRINITY_DN82272_c0_g1~~TRINITY_DN82272_c0_g1_i1.p1  ORF type:complete len:273 (-),score=71.17 TRINITY_DN82272_c0_g1_i1:85-903(-)